MFNTDNTIGVLLFYRGGPFAFRKHELADKRSIYAFRTRINEHFYSGNDDEAVQILANDLRKTQLGSLKLIEPVVK